MLRTTKPIRFGREVVGNPTLVYDLPLKGYSGGVEKSYVPEFDKEDIVHTISPSKTGGAGGEEGQKNPCGKRIRTE